MTAEVGIPNADLTGPLHGPTPRGVRHCQWLCDDGTKCGERFEAGPTEQVVALCFEHGVKACPTGTLDEQVAQYIHLRKTYGWKAN